jgi:hypothetical protein
MFHGSRLSLSTWFDAIAIVVEADTRISGRRLSQLFGVNKDTGCRIALSIAVAMHDAKQRHLLIAIADLHKSQKGAYSDESIHHQGESEVEESNP